MFYVFRGRLSSKALVFLLRRTEENIRSSKVTQVTHRNIVVVNRDLKWIYYYKVKIERSPTMSRAKIGYERGERKF